MRGQQQTVMINMEGVMSNRRPTLQFVLSKYYRNIAWSIRIDLISVQYIIIILNFRQIYFISMSYLSYL